MALYFVVTMIQKLRLYETKTTGATRYISC